MTQDQTPSLRFPEFRGAWEMKRLGEALTSISNGLNLEQVKEVTSYKVTRIETISNDVINTEKVGYIKPEQDISSYKLNIGDMLYSNINSLSHIGRVVIIDRDYNLYHGMNLLRLVVDKNLNNPQFIYYLLNTEEIKLSFKSRANPAVNQASINQTELSKTRIIVPPLAEQEKIAECLSSLDEVITVHGDRLDGLKDYKRGLMQQLFPADGQTTPTLRFPEFQGKDSWQEKRLAEVCSKIPQGGTPDTTKPDYWNGSINWLTPAEMGKTKDRFMHTTVRKITELGLKKCSSDLLPINSIIVSTRAPIGYLTINKTEMAFNQGCKGLVPNKTTSYDFLYYTLLFYKNSLIALGSGSTFKELTGSSLKNFKVTFPSLEEQEKIADCLSVMDELITAQEQKIKTLKHHKNGLMQQLFPKL